jgi:hypothetical protein
VEYLRDDGCRRIAVEACWTKKGCSSENLWAGMRGYPEDACVVAARGGRGESKQDTPVEDGVMARSVGEWLDAGN